jgi:hypothetical protein
MARTIKDDLLSLYEATHRMGKFTEINPDFVHQRPIQAGMRGVQTGGSV